MWWSEKKINTKKNIHRESKKVIVKYISNLIIYIYIFEHNLVAILHSIEQLLKKKKNINVIIYIYQIYLYSFFFSVRGKKNCV